MIATWVNGLSEGLWEFFLPLLILLGLFINIKMLKARAKISYADTSSWQLSKIRGALSISLASKVGTGAIIGVLAAMWQGSVQGGSGEGIVFWVLVGMFFLVPITYSEVLFTQICKQTPRDFIKTNFTLILIAFVPYIIQMIIAYSEYGKATAFHTYLAKLSAVVQSAFILFSASVFSSSEGRHLSHFPYIGLGSMIYSLPNLSLFDSTISLPIF
jgi:hypothetical protein